MRECRECGKPVSSEAKTCPSCGIAKPAPNKGLSMAAQIRWAFLLVFGFFVFKLATPTDDQPTGAPTSTQQTATARDPDIVRQEQVAAERDRIAKMPRAELVKMLSDELLPVCKAANRSLNYIEVKTRGNGLYCVHDFYSQHTLSIGPLGPAMGRFVEERGEELKRARLTRVGVWGTGEYASGSYFDVP